MVFLLAKHHQPNSSPSPAQLLQTSKNQRLCSVKCWFFCSPCASLAPLQPQFQTLHVTAWKLGRMQDSFPAPSVCTASPGLSTCGSNSRGSAALCGSGRGWADPSLSPQPVPGRGSRLWDVFASQPNSCSPRRAEGRRLQAACWGQAVVTGSTGALGRRQPLASVSVPAKEYRKQMSQSTACAPLIIPGRPRPPPASPPSCEECSRAVCKKTLSDVCFGLKCCRGNC